MTTVSRLLAPALLAVGLGVAALIPSPAHAQDAALSRVLVDVADVVLQGGQPYYRYGQYGPNDRLIVQRDRYGRPVYYRVVPRYTGYRQPYGNAYGYNRYDTGYNGNAYPQTSQRVNCSRSGNCTVKYYDPRYDNRGYQGRYDDRRGNGHGRGHGHGHHDDD